jgi:hypothetical protein
LIAGAIYSVDRDPGCALTLYPHSGVACVTGIARRR